MIAFLASALQSSGEAASRLRTTDDGRLLLNSAHCSARSPPPPPPFPHAFLASPSSIVQIQLRRRALMHIASNRPLPPVWLALRLDASEELLLLASRRLPSPGVPWPRRGSAFPPQILLPVFELATKKLSTVSSASCPPPHAAISCSAAVALDALLLRHPLLPLPPLRAPDLSCLPQKLRIPESLHPSGHRLLLSIIFLPLSDFSTIFTEDQ
ncbi:uncharacterized protein PAN0_132d6786 [Moesziomyces antarcticus]|uniref:Uncharacterized protein n=1 Tax=Pseudozyma antarctica TaxID=84753 RepID=A0A081CPC8_PSEA2|nr:uncharacterized protein PAN0_132d6786 [Moesziomyces antarcticus]GAK68524.1 hypothetical protein PAN0_132d6786 [Moesziomyces antarcticus]